MFGILVEEPNRGFRRADNMHRGIRTRVRQSLAEQPALNSIVIQKREYGSSLEEKGHW